MAWRVAKSLNTLLDQVNAIAPRRSKKSDGSIGDQSHASRASDHNSWIRDGAYGVVSARDFTHDPAGGFDAYKFAETLRANGDSRIKYVISNRRIFSGTGQNQPAWVWRKYNGVNPHDKHTHVSVKPDKAHYDSVAPWDLGVPVTSQPVPIPPPADTTVPNWPLLKRGMTGGYIPALQLALRAKGYEITVDGDFGPKTEQIVKTFQARSGLVADGKVGPQTIQALFASVAVGPNVGVSKPVHGLVSSAKAVEHIKSFESCNPTAHQVGGVWHICWGRSNTSGKEPKITKGLTLSQSECDAMFLDDLKDVEDAVKRNLKLAELTQGQFDALVSLTYNKGQTWLRDSQVLVAANNKDWAKVAELILKEVPAPDHKFYKGLLRRRKAEVALLNS